jgi:membrane protein implicated in regulation of membrane protease activity
MNADFTTVVGWIVGIVVVVEFFHIGYLVSAIRKEARKQTKLLLVSTGALVGKSGMLSASDVWNVRILDEDWECAPPNGIGQGAKVTVKSMDGILPVVEAAEQVE